MVLTLLRDREDAPVKFDSPANWGGLPLPWLFQDLLCLAPDSPHFWDQHPSRTITRALLRRTNPVRVRS